MRFLLLALLLSLSGCVFNELYVYDAPGYREAAMANSNAHDAMDKARENGQEFVCRHFADAVASQYGGAGKFVRVKMKEYPYTNHVFFVTPDGWAIDNLVSVPYRYDSSDLPLYGYEAL